MKAPLRVGIAGLGRLGKRHAEQLARHTPGARLVAACSPVPAELDWARAELGVQRCHADYEDLLRDPEVDAVVLVTPTTLHADQTSAALRAGKHVFVEKPLSLDAATCEAVASQYPNLVAMVGFVRRFDPSCADAKTAIDAGNLGRPFLVRSQTCDQNDPEGFFVRFAPTSGGIFMDCSMHVTSTWPAGCSVRPGRCAPTPAAPSPATPIWRSTRMSTTAWPSSSSKAARGPCCMPRAPLHTAMRPRPR